MAPNVQECDTTGDDGGTTAGNKKEKSILLKRNEFIRPCHSQTLSRVYLIFSLQTLDLHT